MFYNAKQERGATKKDLQMLIHNDDKMHKLMSRVKEEGIGILGCGSFSEDQMSAYIEKWMGHYNFLTDHYNYMLPKGLDKNTMICNQAQNLLFSRDYLIMGVGSNPGQLSRETRRRLCDIRDTYTRALETMIDMCWQKVRIAA